MYQTPDEDKNTYLMIRVRDKECATEGQGEPASRLIQIESGAN